MSVLKIHQIDIAFKEKCEAISMEILSVTLYLQHVGFRSCETPIMYFFFPEIKCLAVHCNATKGEKEIRF